MSSYSTCTQAKVPQTLPAGKFKQLPIPVWQWSHLALDFITDLPESQGNTTILVIIDRFSKSLHLIPLAILSAFATAELLFQHVFRYFGIPEEIVIDRGPQFTSRVWSSFMEKMGVPINLNSGYHPQANRQVQWASQEVTRFLQTFCTTNPEDWGQFLPWAEYAQNSLRHSATQLTPFQYVWGYQPPWFPWNANPTNSPAVGEWFRRSEEVWERTHQHLVQASHTTKADRHRRDHPNYQPGDRVWLSMKVLKLPLLCRKLNPRYIGPFRINEQINEVTYQLGLPKHSRIAPTFHISLLKLVIPGPLATAVPGDSPPEPLEIDGQPAYHVRTILNSRRRRGKLEYLVDWEGYGPEEQCWILSQDILDPRLSRDFHAAHPAKPGPQRRGRPRRYSAPRVSPSGGWLCHVTANS